MGQRLTTMTSGQARFPDRAVEVQVRAARQSGMWVSELLPWTAKMVDDMCFIRSMHTEAINHEPAITLHADRQPDHRPAVPRLVGFVRPRSLNDNLPTFVVLVAKPTQHRAGAGDLRPAVVVRLSARRARRRFASAPPAIRFLYINNPPGVSAQRPPHKRSTA